MDVNVCCGGEWLVTVIEENTYVRRRAGNIHIYIYIYILGVKASG